MPLYDYRCYSCGREWEAFQRLDDRYDEICECGNTPEIIIKPLRVKPQIMDYFDEHLDAKITGPAQRRKIMKEKGLSEKE